MLKCFSLLLKWEFIKNKRKKRKCLALCLIMIVSMIVFIGITYFLEHSLTNVLTFCFYECIAVAFTFLFYKVT